MAIDRRCSDDDCLRDDSLEDGLERARSQSRAEDKVDEVDEGEDMGREHDEQDLAMTSLPGRQPAAASPRYPPSFAESQFHTIVRRQRRRRRGSLKGRQDGGDGGGGGETTQRHSTYARRTSTHDVFHFAGWGGMSHLDLTASDYEVAAKRLEMERRRAVLGQFKGTAIAGNDLLGSVFYAFPAVIAVSSVYSPLVLFVATLMLLPWRWIMPELASAFCDNSSNYAYLSNTSTKRFLAIAAASATLLDYVATAVVGSASGAAYLAGEVDLPISVYWITASIIVGVAVLSLCGLRESTNMAFVVIAFHCLTMCVLGIAGIYAWARNGNRVLLANWSTYGPGSASDILKALFYGVSLGALGCTGLEIVASQVQELKPGAYSKVLRNLYIAVICLNGPLMLLIWAVLPEDALTSGANVLSIFAETAVRGKWLRYWVVVDAMAVLCSDVLTGIVPVCGLFERLISDRVLPLFLGITLPRTRSKPLMILTFTCVCLLFLVTTQADLAVESNIFSFAFLSILALYLASNISLKINRGRLVRAHRAGTTTILAAILVLLLVFAGSIAQEPVVLLYWAAWFVGIFIVMTLLQKRVEIKRFVAWTLQVVRPMKRLPLLRRFGFHMIGIMKRDRAKCVIYFVKRDEISSLMEGILYVQANESSGHVQLVHIYDSIDAIPSELEANHRLIDEAFPSVTVDLVFIQGVFDARTVEAISHRCNVPKGLMFATCPGPGAHWTWSDMGIRLIM